MVKSIPSRETNTAPTQYAVSTGGDRRASAMAIPMYRASVAEELLGELLVGEIGDGNAEDGENARSED